MVSPLAAKLKAQNDTYSLEVERATWLRLGNGFPRSGVWPGSPQDRRIADKAMAAFRKAPRVRYAQKVTLTATAISQELRDRALPGFPQGENFIWMRNRKLSRQLVAQDRAVGGLGWLARIEYRHCRVCKQLLVGPEATDYREKMRRPKKSWDTRWGPKCNVECRRRTRASRKPQSSC